jgi:hypothetical protein
MIERLQPQDILLIHRLTLRNSWSTAEAWQVRRLTIFPCIPTEKRGQIRNCDASMRKSQGEGIRWRWAIMLRKFSRQNFFIPTLFFVEIVLFLSKNWMMSLPLSYGEATRISKSPWSHSALILFKHHCILFTQDCHAMIYLFSICFAHETAGQCSLPHTRYRITKISSNWMQ